MSQHRRADALSEDAAEDTCDAVGGFVSIPERIHEKRKLVGLAGLGGLGAGMVLEIDPESGLEWLGHFDHLRSHALRGLVDIEDHTLVADVVVVAVFGHGVSVRTNHVHVKKVGVAARRYVDVEGKDNVVDEGVVFVAGDRGLLGEGGDGGFEIGKVFRNFVPRHPRGLLLFRFLILGGFRFESGRTGHHLVVVIRVRLLVGGLVLYGCESHDGGGDQTGARRGGVGSHARLDDVDVLEEGEIREHLFAVERIERVDVEGGAAVREAAFTHQPFMEIGHKG